MLGHAAARHRQGQGTRARGQGHPAGPRARPRGWRCRRTTAAPGGVPRRASPHDVARAPSGATSTTRKTIADFAGTVGDAQRLRMLYLLTYADMRAVGPGVLTGWQAAILHELLRRTLTRLTGGRERRAQPYPDSPSGCAQAVTDDVSPPGGEGPRGDGVGALPRPTPACSGWPSTCGCSRRLDGAPVATELFHHPTSAPPTLVVVTRDVPGLFSLIAGTLAAHRRQHHLRADRTPAPTASPSTPSRSTIRPARSSPRPRSGARVLDALRRGAHRRAERWRRCWRGGGARGARPTGLQAPKIAVDNQLSGRPTP
mgnify:CR=1 FL=1